MLETRTLLSGPAPAPPPCCRDRGCGRRTGARAGLLAAADDREPLQAADGVPSLRHARPRRRDARALGAHAARPDAPLHGRRPGGRRGDRARRGYVAGRLVERTLDYFAQSDDGTVYYLGENVRNIRRGSVVNRSGSWRLGRDTDVPGVLMPPDPHVGDQFRPEDIAASRRVRPRGGDRPARTRARTLYTDVSASRSSSSPRATWYKLYAPGVGTIVEYQPEGRAASCAAPEPVSRRRSPAPRPLLRPRRRRRRRCCRGRRRGRRRPRARDGPSGAASGSGSGWACAAGRRERVAGVERLGLEPDALRRQARRGHRDADGDEQPGDGERGPEQDAADGHARQRGRRAVKNRQSASCPAAGATSATVPPPSRGAQRHVAAPAARELARDRQAEAGARRAARGRRRRGGSARRPAPRSSGARPGPRSRTSSRAAGARRSRPPSRRASRRARSRPARRGCGRRRRGSSQARRRRRRRGAQRWPRSAAVAAQRSAAARASVAEREPLARPRRARRRG